MKPGELALKPGELGPRPISLGLKLCGKYGLKGFRVQTRGDAGGLYAGECPGRSAAGWNPLRKPCGVGEGCGLNPAGPLVGPEGWGLSAGGDGIHGSCAGVSYSYDGDGDGDGDVYTLKGSSALVAGRSGGLYGGVGLAACGDCGDSASRGCDAVAAGLCGGGEGSEAWSGLKLGE